MICHLRSTCLGILLLALAGETGATGVYQPIEGWIDPQVESLATLEGRLQGSTALAKGSGTVTAGIRQAPPKGVSLLEGYMLQRHPKLLGNSPARARALIDRQYSRSLGPLRGYTAEAVFVDRNPEWNFVKSGNASQHDVTRRVPGRRAPYNGQIKYHNSGSPTTYAADMVKDWRANRFFIPDDHVEPTKAYLRQKAERYLAQGDSLNAKRLWRDYGRTRGIGATSIEIRSLTDDAGRYTAAEQRAILARRAASGAQMARPVTVVTRAGVTATNVRAGLGKSAYRGGHGRYLPAALSQRANYLVGGVTAIALTVVLIHEHGGRYAFSRPEFYIDAVGTAAAFGLGYYAGSAATTYASGAGPWAPVIGAVVAVAAGTAAYAGGRTLARVLITLFAPKILRASEIEKVSVARSIVEGKITRLQALE